jgi:hypothetical protein
VTAESYGDIFGIVMKGIADHPMISVMIKDGVPPDELGPNAILFQKMMLEHPGFGLHAGRRAENHRRGLISGLR